MYSVQIGFSLITCFYDFSSWINLSSNQAGLEATNDFSWLLIFVKEVSVLNNFCWGAGCSIILISTSSLKTTFFGVWALSYSFFSSTMNSSHDDVWTVHSVSLTFLSFVEAWTGKESLSDNSFGVKDFSYPMTFSGFLLFLSSCFLFSASLAASSAAFYSFSNFLASYDNFLSQFFCWISSFHFYSSSFSYSISFLNCFFNFLSLVYERSISFVKPIGKWYLISSSPWGYCLMIFSASSSSLFYSLSCLDIDLSFGFSVDSIGWSSSGSSHAGV